MFGLFTFVMAYVKNFGAAIAVRFSAFAVFFPFALHTRPRRR